MASGWFKERASYSEVKWPAHSLDRGGLELQLSTKSLIDPVIGEYVLNRWSAYWI